MADRLSPLDSYFLHAEDDGLNHMHLGGLIILDGDPPPYEDVCSFVLQRLDQIVRYKQVIKTVPFNLSRPVWVDDTNFDIRFHVREAALPSSGSHGQLRTLFERIMSQRLDRTRPVWELWLVHGLAGGGWAVISKTHHAMVDGVSGTELMSMLFSADPSVPHFAAAPDAPVEAQPSPSSVQLMQHAVKLRFTNPTAQIRTLGNNLQRSRGLLDTAIAGLGATVRVLRPNAVGALNGRVGPNRRFAFDHRSLDDIRAVRRAFGGTINDVVLAAATMGFRDLLLTRGEAVEGRTVRALIPVAVHARDERGVAVGDPARLENRVSGLFAELPVGLEDPVACLREMTQQLGHLKVSGHAQAGATLTRISEYAPAALFALGVRAGSRAGQRNVNTTVTNVPGPRVPLYLLGRQVSHIYAYPPPFPVGARTAIGVYSYLGNVNFGVTADYSSVPDVDVICQGMQQAFSTMKERAG